MMKIPIVEQGKFVIIISDYNTGIILNNDGSYYQNEGDNYYEIIEGKGNAIAEINKKLNEKEGIEIILYDNKGKFLELYRR